LVRRAAAATPPPPFTACLRSFEEEFDYVYRALRRHGVSAIDAEDLVQDVFVVMWRRWSDFETDRPLRPWLAGIAFRVARHHRRRNGREVPGGDLDLDLEPERPRSDEDDAFAAADARDLVLRALARLPERHRTPIVLHDLDGMPVEEIAGALGIPPATVYTRVRRARMAFAKVVDRVQRNPVRPGPARRPAAPEPALSAQELLALERQTSPTAPAETRHRAQERARRAVVLLAAGARPGQPEWWPTLRGQHPARPLLPVPPAAPAGVPLVAGAVAGAAVALLAFLAWPHRPARLGGPLSDQPDTSAASATVSTTTPTLFAIRPPRLAPAPPAQADEDGDEGAMARRLGLGLTGYWRLDDGAGSPQARDLSGRGHHCLLRGTDPAHAWTDGVLGGGVRLDGKGWLECPQPQVTAGTPVEMTVAAWVQRSRSVPYRVAVATRQLGSASKDFFFFGFEPGDRLRVMSHAWIGWVTRSMQPSAVGQWTHLAFAHAADGTTRLYVDGKQVGQMFGKARGEGVIGGPLTIGAGINGRSTTAVRQRLDGSFDEVLVYDRALSPEEIAALAARTQPRLPDPI
jgi:RNA polymerase sigma factor (sigma-70 family)